MKQYKLGRFIGASGTLYYTIKEKFFGLFWITISDEGFTSFSKATEVIKNLQIADNYIAQYTSL